MPAAAQFRRTFCSTALAFLLAAASSPAALAQGYEPKSGQAGTHTTSLPACPDFGS